MSMTPPTPDTCSSTRVSRSDGETYVTPTAVLENEPCLFSVFEPGMTTGSFMGPIDTTRTVLFIGYAADIKMGDEVTNDSTSEVFVVTEPPTKFRNPQTWENDHQQVALRPAPLN